MDKALKQRLVGASVLIILAVIVLPMLLSGRSDRHNQESRQIELPPKPDELSIETRRFPVGVPDRPVPNAELEVTETLEPDNLEQPPTEDIDLVSGNPDEQEVPSPQQATASEELQPLTTDVGDLTTDKDELLESGSPVNTEDIKPAVTSIILTSDKPESLELSQPVVDSEGAPRYLVQVASFSNEQNASALADLLRAENLPVLMDVVERPAGSMYRVRVGPYAKRPEADALVSSLGKKMKDITPRVLDLRPDESTPVSTPSDPLVRWVVQVGSFSSAKSADALVSELRLAGLNAYSEKVTSAAAVVFKVRIGPELDRDKATELAAKVKAEHHLDTFVTTQE